MSWTMQRLQEPEPIRAGSGGAYKVFTPFARACLARGDPAARARALDAFAHLKRAGQASAAS